MPPPVSSPLQHEKAPSAITPAWIISRDERARPDDEAATLAARCCRTSTWSCSRAKRACRCGSRPIAVTTSRCRPSASTCRWARGEIALASFRRRRAATSPMNRQHGEQDGADQAETGRARDAAARRGKRQRQPGRVEDRRQRRPGERLAQLGQVAQALARIARLRAPASQQSVRVVLLAGSRGVPARWSRMVSSRPSATRARRRDQEQGQQGVLAAAAEHPVVNLQGEHAAPTSIRTLMAKLIAPASARGDHAARRSSAEATDARCSAPFIFPTCPPIMYRLTAGSARPTIRARHARSDCRSSLVSRAVHH